MSKEVLWSMPHIALAYVDSGDLCLTVEDTGLNDYVEDFLWDEFEFGATSVSLQHHSKPAIYHNYFVEGTSVERVIEKLKQLNLKEVERIYGLHHS
jgi:hypothetical protein